MPDLRQEQSRVEEANIGQGTIYIRVEVSPLSVVLLVDNDLKSRDAKEVSESLRSIVAGLSADDEALVCRFDQFFHPGKGFTSDQDKLLTELKRTRLDEEPSVAPSGPP